MATLIAVALVILAAVALGWWLLASRRPAPALDPGFGPEPPFPGWEMYEGELRYQHHARERMTQRGITEQHIRHLIANGSPEPGRKDRVVYGCTMPDCRVMHVVTSQGERALYVITAWVDDPRNTKVRVPASRVRFLHENREAIERETSARITVGPQDKRGRAYVLVTSLPVDHDEAVAMVTGKE
jgi:hypothetical protein